MYFLLFYIAIALYWIGTGYLRSDPTFIAGLALLLPATLVRHPGVGSWRMGVTALLCVALALVLHARTFHFLALAFSALFVWENTRGRINEAPVLILFLLTAVVKTMSVILGFSIRLQLSAGAAGLLQLAGQDARADGNLILLRGERFSVDPECMGLQMLETSFLFGFFLLAYFEKRSSKRLSWPWLLAAVAGMALLNVLFNFLRILLLVLFKVAPGTISHDALGLAGLALYVFLPLWAGLRWLYAKKGINLEPLSVPRVLVSGKKTVLMYVLSGALLVLLARNATMPADTVNEGTAIVPKGMPANMQAESLGDGVVKYAGADLLIYVKPVRGFYSTEHTPLICWQGSGYRFDQIREEKTGMVTWYAGVLKKDTALLYTAWWYDNGQVRTTSQWRWRSLDAGGAPGFCLVNVSASSEETLKEQVARMLLP